MQQPHEEEVADYHRVVRMVEEHVGHVQHAFNMHQRTFYPPRVREFFALELCGEAGELANIEKKRWKGMQIPESSFDEEAADVFIALFNYCNAAGVNLAYAVCSKLRSMKPNTAPSADVE